MKIFIAAGGSGTKILEGLVHLCAAGLGPDKIKVLVIDPDQANGNRRRAANLLTLYKKCREAFRSDAAGHDFFKTEFEVLPVDGAVASQSGDELALPAWSPVRPKSDLNEVFQFNLLDPTHQDVMRLLFTQAERTTTLNLGFQGHPSIGAAVMALLPQVKAKPPAERPEPWRTLISDLEYPGNSPSGIDAVIGGSVFGGTGASTFYPLARFLRGLPLVNSQALRIHAFLLVPYFGFPPGAPFAANSNRFPLATKAAALFYDHLRAAAPQAGGDGWPFASTSWLGDTGRLEIDDFELGGNQQANQPYFVDMLAAWSVLGLLSAPVPVDGGPSRYCGPAGRDESGNLVRWDDVPVPKGGTGSRDTFKRSAMSFLRVGSYHSEFVSPVLGARTQAQLCDFLPWYRRKFGSPKLSLQGVPWAKLREFFTDYHFPWWKEIHETGKGRVRLLNPGAFVTRDSSVIIPSKQIANLEYRDIPANELIDDNYAFEFTKNVVKAEKLVPLLEQAGPMYLSILAHASDEFGKSQQAKKR